MSDETADFGPILDGPGASDYERYLRTDELLALQKPVEEQSHRDELLFQTVHQSSELWLKHACFEVEEATVLIAAGDLTGAIRLLRRAVLGLRLVTRQLDMLEHMSPWEYQEVRKALGHGSGFDSPGFNRIKVVSPPLGEAFLEALERAGLGVVDLYQRGREFEDLYQLAELLMDWDERISLWRSHHFKMVERIIGGHVVGTQGTPVELLSRLHEHVSFPVLWEARTLLTEASKQAE
ncbi:MAG: tryptophan 2,3-dioxygenase family protein [Acidimicrobiia bacterium]|nr:tryptophan 2,3-dioxygenase family protein [Acidimicrobiia bacterium]